MKKISLDLARKVFYDKFILGLSHVQIGLKHNIDIGTVITILMGKRKYIREWKHLGFLGPFPFITRRKEHGKPEDGIKYYEYIYSDLNKIEELKEI